MPLLTTLLTWRTVTKGLCDPRLLAVDWLEAPQKSLASCGFSPDIASKRDSVASPPNNQGSRAPRPFGLLCCCLENHEGVESVCGEGYVPS